MTDKNEKTNSGYTSKEPDMKTPYKGLEKHFFYFGRGVQDDYQETMEKYLCDVGTTC